MTLFYILWGPRGNTDVLNLPAAGLEADARGAAAHMFGAPMRRQAYQLPYGIYTIPEIAMIRRTEEQLTAASIPYETGVARYEELAKAEMLGDRTGMLKVLFDPETLKLMLAEALLTKLCGAFNGLRLMWGT